MKTNSSTHIRMLTLVVAVAVLALLAAVAAFPSLSQALTLRRVVRQRRSQHLQRNLASEPRVDREVHHTHATSTQLARDVVGTDEAARLDTRPGVEQVLRAIEDRPRHERSSSVVMAEQ